jgi:hypothetical protein
MHHEMLLQSGAPSLAVAAMLWNREHYNAAPCFDASPNANTLQDSIRMHPCCSSTMATFQPETNTLCLLLPAAAKADRVFAAQQHCQHIFQQF